MNGVRRVAGLVRYTWLAAWGRTVVVSAPGLVLLILVAQLPRIAAIRAAFRRNDGQALSEYVAFVSSLQANLLLAGACLALALGAFTTSRRHTAPTILQIAARPVRRGELLFARLVGHGLVLVSFWFAPALVLEVLRRGCDAPLGLPPGAYVAPLLAHGFLLVLGAVLGTRWPPLPATLAGVLVSWILVSAGDGSIASLVGAPLARSCSFLVPPLAELLSEAASPFAGVDFRSPAWATWGRMLAWIGIATLVAETLWARLDLSSRPY